MTVGIEPAAGLEAVHGCVPDLVAPAASPSCLVLAGAGDERCRGLAGVEPGAHETADVPIAAVLAQQIEGVPEEEMRRVRPGQRRMRRIQHPPAQVARRRRLARQAGGLDHRRGGDPAMLKAAYRFFANDAIEPQDVLDSHIEATSRRLHHVPVVLAVQDTTEVDWTSHPATRGLGPLGPRACQGLLVHSTLAFTPERLPLGLL